MGFSEIKGQERVARVLATLYRKNIQPAFMLFVGGAPGEANSAASLFIQANLCENPLPQEGGCGQCGNCRKIAHRGHPDVHIIDQNYQKIVLGKRASVTQLQVDTVRESLRLLYQRPFQSAYTFVVVEGAETLTAQAQNALLKILEEAPSHVLWIWLASSDESLLPTVLSRAIYKLYFKPQTKVRNPENKSFNLTPTQAYEMSQRVARSRFIKYAYARKEIRQIFDEIKNQLYSLWCASGDLVYIPRLKAILDGEQDLESNLTPALVLESTLLKLSAKLGTS